MIERKKNRLADYDYSQPGAYFITVCTKDRKCILSTVVGADAHIGPQVQLTRTGQVAQRYLETIPGIGPYVIMPNHVHMIIHIPARDLPAGPMRASAPTEGERTERVREVTIPYAPGTHCPRALPASAPTVGILIRAWKGLVTKALGQSIWQRSFYDHVIRSEQEYTEIGEYILGNPGKWAEDKYFYTD